MKNKTKEELINELTELKKTHKDLWETYGSELCASEMLRKEEELEKNIKKLENEENIHNLSSNSSD